VFELLLLKVAAKLQKLKIDYMIVGSQAGLIDEEPGLIKNIEITLAVETDRWSEILNFSKELKLRVLADDPDDFTNKTKILTMMEIASGIRIDFIFSSSEYDRLAISRAVSVKFGKAAVRFASLEDLIIHKIIAGRPNDVEDVKSILSRNFEYDKKYIKKWLGEFDKALDTFYVESFKSVIRQLK
jgi:hypothetical protein